MKCVLRYAPQASLTLNNRRLSRAFFLSSITEVLQLDDEDSRAIAFDDSSLDFLDVRFERVKGLSIYSPVRGYSQFYKRTEYFTLAAALGLRFLYVPGAVVRYNHWSSTQKSRSVSYCKRVQTLHYMECADNIMQQSN